MSLILAQHYRVLMLVAMVATANSAPLSWSYAAGNYSWAVAVSGDGRYAIAGSDDMQTYFFHTAEGVPLWSHPANGYVRHVAISRDGTYAASGDMDGTILLLRFDGARVSFSSFKADSAIEALAMSDSGEYLAAGDRSGNMYIFQDQALSAVLRNKVPGGVLAIALAESMAFAVTAAQGGLYFFDEATSHSAHAWSFGEDTTLAQLAMTSDSSHILAGGNDGNIYLLDNSGRLVDRRDAGGAISALSISDVTHLTIVGTVSGTISLYSADAGFNNGESLETGNPITSAAISKNGRRISVANLQGTVSTFDGSLRAPLWTYDAGGIVHSLSLSRDGRVLAAASDTGSIYLFDEGEAAGADNRGLFVQLPILAVLAVTVTVCTILLRRRDKSKRLRNETNEGHASDLASSFAKRAG